jgi:hypothetical protein
MPPVAAFVAAYLGISMAMAYFVIASAVVMVASISYSAYTMATMKGAEGFSAEIAGRTQVVRSAVAPHRIVYGKCMISGPLVAAFSYGVNNEFVYLAIALTSHEVEEIGDVYLNDTLSTDIKWASTNGTDLTWNQDRRTIPSSGVVILDNAVYGPALYVHYGLITGDFTGTDVPVNLWTYEKGTRRITFDTSMIGQAVTIRYTKSYVSITKYLGTVGQTADADLIADAVDRAGNHVWTSAHKLTGRSYLVVRLEFNPTIFASGLPNIKAVVKGVKDIYDPRTGTTGWTDNATLCIRDYLVKPYGLGAVAGDINDINFIAAANICDEVVSARVGTGAGYLTDGSYYEVGTTGIYLTAGTGTILAGDIITINIAGGIYNIDGTPTVFSASANSYIAETVLSSGYLVLSGNGITAAIPPTPCIIVIADINTEKRYTCNGSFTLDQKPIDIMKKMLTACAGRLVWSQGTYTLYPAAYNYPVGTLTESDLRDDMSVLPAPSRQQRFNTVRGTFVSPAQYWQQVDFPYQQNSTQYVADGNFEICQTLELPYTISASASQRLAVIYLNQNLRGITVTFPAKLTAFKYQPGDVINLSIAQLGWTAKGFRITDWKLSDNGGVDLILREEDPTIYGWTLSNEKPFFPPATPNVADYVVVAVPGEPTDLTAIIAGQGIVLNWIAPVGKVVVTKYNIYMDGNLLVAAYQGNEYIYNVLIPRTYYFTVTALNVNDREGAASNTASITIVTVNAVTGIVPTSKIFAISLSLTYTPLTDFAAIEIWAATTNNRADAGKIGETTTTTFLHAGLPLIAAYYYWTRIRDVYGNYGEWYPSVSNAGVSGSTSINPADYLTILLGGITKSQLATELLTPINSIDTEEFVLDADIIEPNIVDGLNGAFCGLSAVQAVQHAIIGNMQAQYTVKLNVNGRVAGFGLMLSEDTPSEFVIVAEKFQVIDNADALNPKQVFTIGNINGVSAVGINGDLIIDGSIMADKITVSTLAALVADMGAITAGSIVVGTTNKLWLNDSEDGGLNIGGATKAIAPFRVSNAGEFFAGTPTRYINFNGSDVLVGGDIIVTGNIHNLAITRGADYYNAVGIVYSNTELEMGTLSITCNTATDTIYLWAKAIITVDVSTNVGGKGTSPYYPTIIRLRADSLSGTVLDSARVMVHGLSQTPVGVPTANLVGIALSGFVGTKIIKLTVQGDPAYTPINDPMYKGTVAYRYMTALVRSK